MHKAKLLGGVTIVLHRGAGAYICGEETALLESLEGKRGQPRTKPPFPAIAGLYASPSLINNVETIATVPKIIELGAKEYAKIGVPPDSSGTRVFSLSGNVVNGGNYELPMGVTLRELIYDFGGGIPGGRELKAVIPGGSSVPVLTADQVDVSLDASSMAEAGSMLGSGAIIVIDDRCCMVQLGLRVAQFYMHESCGKCTPCREGTRWMVQILEAIEEGTASQGDLDLLLDVCDRILGKCLCPLGDAAAMPVASYIDKFRDEFQEHIDSGCPMHGESSLEHVLAPVDQHTHAPGGRGARVSAVEQVKVTVDGREVEVAKGTGLVETAAAAGIEIPVFCYEPRLGPPVGACRMCLVEIEGMPKLQAGCTLTAQDGMVVRTARSSAKAAEGQEATLEFILVNHPLDCPVCDKGGECPLQDLTFKYGPGSTRMTFPKRTFDKPIPISPTIALDRERCILCYRCTRFSSDVAEDGQLVARNRGAQSLITTFEDEAYRAPFSGNVIELCPVGALTSTQYRFESRPWEIQNVPTVCGLCPVGCNISATTREGKVKRVISRNHPEVDQGWLCDKGRFAFPYLYAGDRILDPLERVRRRGFGELSWDDALDRAEALLRGCAGADRHRALRLRDRRAGVRARQAAAPGARRELGRAAGGDLVRARRLPGAALDDRGCGDRRRHRRRGGRGPRSDRRPLDQAGSPQRRRGRPGGRAEARREARAARLRLRPRRPDLVRPRRRRRGAAGRARAPARTRREARLRRLQPAVDAECARGRRRLGGGRRGRGGEPGADRAPDRLRRRGCVRPGRARARRAGGARDRDHDVPRPRGRLGGPRPARHELPRA